MCRASGSESLVSLVLQASKIWGIHREGRGSSTLHGGHFQCGLSRGTPFSPAVQMGGSLALPLRALRPVGLWQAARLEHRAQSRLPHVSETQLLAQRHKQNHCLARACPEASSPASMSLLASD